MKGSETSGARLLWDGSETRGALSGFILALLLIFLHGFHTEYMGVEYPKA